MFQMLEDKYQVRRANWASTKRLKPYFIQLDDRPFKFRLELRKHH